MLSCAHTTWELDMRWLQLVGSLKLYVIYAKEPYKRDCILQKRPTHKNVVTQLKVCTHNLWLRFFFGSYVTKLAHTT